MMKTGFNLLLGLSVVYKSITKSPIDVSKRTAILLKRSYLPYNQNSNLSSHKKVTWIKIFILCAALGRGDQFPAQPASPYFNKRSKDMAFPVVCGMP